MNAAASAGDESRMSRPTAMRFGLQIRDERRADGPRAVLVDLVGIDAADVVGLEDVRVHADRVHGVMRLHDLLQPAVIGDHRLVAEHDAVRRRGALRPMWQWRPRIEPPHDRFLADRACSAR